MLKGFSMQNKFSIKTILLLASVGGALEMYDFVIYIFFASTIAKLFFPMESTYASMLSTLAIFATGYLFRPIGGIVFGHIGDRYGRRKSLLFTILLMALSMLAMALMPTYQTIGMAAPILFCFFRLVQGFALGGDLPAAITFVNEYADNSHRGLLTGLLYFGVNFGLLLASFVGMLCTKLLSSEALMQYGWRAAFLFGISLFVVGIYFRLKNIETPLFQQLADKKKQLHNPLATLFLSHPLTLFRAIIMIALHAIIIVQLFLYMPIYLEQVVHIDPSKAIEYNTINILIFSCCIPLIGVLSDLYGRKMFLMIASFLFVVLTYPLYQFINSSGQLYSLSALLVFGLLSALVVGVVPVMLAELFPTNVRNSAIGLTYNVGFGIFGGLSPVVSTYLIHHLRYPAAPSINLIIVAFILLCMLIPMKFSKNKPLP